MTDQESSDQSNQHTGSPSPGEPVFLVIGKLRRPHGLHGELVMDIYTDFPERLETGAGVYIGEAHRLLILQSYRWHGNALLVALEGCSTPEEAGEFRNQLVYVRSDDRPLLPDGEYYHHQIIGMKVINESDELLGRVVEILETGANDIFVVEKENGSELLLPVIDSVVLSINPARGEIRVHLLPGLQTEE